MLSQVKNGLIVEHLETKKRMPVYSTHKISSLEDIAIYTEDKEVILKDIFKGIYKKTDGKKILSPKSSNDELKSFFLEILPNYSQDRVYVSDIKKVVNWYTILRNNDIINDKTIIEEEKVEKEEVSENKE
jgi:ubiquinone biosynthesis protein Coq4